MWATGIMGAVVGASAIGLLGAVAGLSKVRARRAVIAALFVLGAPLVAFFVPLLFGVVVELVLGTSLPVSGRTVLDTAGPVGAGALILAVWWAWRWTVRPMVSTEKG